MNENEKSRRILDMRYPIDHAAMMSVLEEFTSRYPWISVTILGESILGRVIPIVRLGSDGGKEPRRVLYVGAHHGMEWITAGLLLRFINEYCELVKSDGLVEGVRPIYLRERCGLYIVPMLNPDGVDYVINGVGTDNVLRDRLLGMNGGDDFSHWQANARGVDLNHNYNAGFAEYKKIEASLGICGGAPTRFSGESAESEPETAYLCNYLRFSEPFDAALTLHTQGEVIYCGNSTTPESERLGRYLSRLCGYAISRADGPAAYGGFTDWFVREFGRPSFTLECGRGENPLPVSDLPLTYLKLRRALFSFPMAV